jgi:hypothetical protein
MANRLFFGYSCTHTPWPGHVEATIMKHLYSAVLALPAVKIITDAKV